jgi:hypothetical protein
MTPANNDLLAAGPGPARRRLKRALGAAGFAVLGVALLHLPVAKGLLMRLGGCPFAGAQLTPAQMDTARHLALAERKGDSPAPSRPALGFALDATSASTVRRWAAASKVSCEDVRTGLITCANVPPEALSLPSGEGPIDELVLGFNQRGLLVNVTTMRAHLEPRAAATVSSVIASSLRESLGPATRASGVLNPASLAKAGALGMATLSYRYNDYVAEVAAMTLPSSGLSVREHYVSSRD